MRVALVLRSAEVQPLFRRFVQENIYVLCCITIHMHDILVFVLAISPPPTKISYHLQMRVNNNNNNNNTQYNYNYIYTPNNTYISVMILYKVLYKETIVYIMSDMNKCGVVHINTTTTQTHTPQCHKTTHYKRNSYERVV